MEKTPRIYKTIQTAGVLSLLLGVVLLVTAATNETSKSPGAILFWGGILAYAAGRFIPWFKHS